VKIFKIWQFWRNLLIETGYYLLLVFCQKFRKTLSKIRFLLFLPLDCVFYLWPLRVLQYLVFPNITAYTTGAKAGDQESNGDFNSFGKQCSFYSSNIIQGAGKLIVVKSIEILGTAGRVFTM